MAMADTDMAAAVHTVVGDTGPMDSLFKKSVDLLLYFSVILPFFL